MSIKKIGVLALVIVALGGAVYYKMSPSEEVAGEREYYVSEIRPTEFETIVEADGVVEAEDTKLIYADKSLKVENLYFDEGDYVMKDQIIMTFDSEDKNTIDRNIEKEKINIKQFERNLENAKKLYEVGGSSKVEIEDIEFEIAKSKLSLADLEEEVSKMLDEIVSPFDGTIVTMVAEENYRVNTEVELFEMADLSNVIIVAEIPEYDISSIAVGQKVRISPDSSEEEFIGAVEKISTLSIADTGSEASVEIDISIENVPDELRPGFNASVEVITHSSDDTFGIARTAVLEEDGKNYVFVVSDTNVIEKKYVELGMSNTDLLEVIGLEKGTKVMVDPDMSLESGATIIVADPSTRKKNMMDKTKKANAAGGGGPQGGGGGGPRG